MNWQAILGNKIVQTLLIALVIFGICILAGLNFHLSVGANGIDAGINRSVEDK